MYCRRNTNIVDVFVNENSEVMQEDSSSIHASRAHRTYHFSDGRSFSVTATVDDRIPTDYVLRNVKIDGRNVACVNVTMRFGDAHKFVSDPNHIAHVLKNTFGFGSDSTELLIAAARSVCAKAGSSSSSSSSKKTPRKARKVKKTRPTSTGKSSSSKSSSPSSSSSSSKKKKQPSAVKQKPVVAKKPKTTKTSSSTGKKPKPKTPQKDTTKSPKPTKPGSKDVKGTKPKSSSDSKSSSSSKSSGKGSSSSKKKAAEKKPKEKKVSSDAGTPKEKKEKKSAQTQKKGKAKESTSTGESSSSGVFGSIKNRVSGIGRTSDEQYAAKEARKTAEANAKAAASEAKAAKAAMITEQLRSKQQERELLSTTGASGESVVPPSATPQQWVKREPVDMTREGISGPSDANGPKIRATPQKESKKGFDSSTTSSTSESESSDGSSSSSSRDIEMPESVSIDNPIYEPQTLNAPHGETWLGRGDKGPPSRRHTRIKDEKKHKKKHRHNKRKDRPPPLANAHTGMIVAW